MIWIIVAYVVVGLMFAYGVDARCDTIGKGRPTPWQFVLAIAAWPIIIGALLFENLLAKIAAP